MYRNIIRKNNKPIALDKTLGCDLFGGNQSTSTCQVTNKLALNISTNNFIQKFWDIESYDTKPRDDLNIMTVNDIRPMEILQKATTKCESHYTLSVYLGKKSMYYY